jgi:hypothetical protein
LSYARAYDQLISASFSGAITLEQTTGNYFELNYDSTADSYFSDENPHFLKIYISKNSLGDWAPSWGSCLDCGLQDPPASAQVSQIIDGVTGAASVAFSITDPGVYVITVFHMTAMDGSTSARATAVRTVTAQELAEEYTCSNLTITKKSDGEYELSADTPNSPSFYYYTEYVVAKNARTSWKPPLETSMPGWSNPLPGGVSLHVSSTGSPKTVISLSDPATYYITAYSAFLWEPTLYVTSATCEKELVIELAASQEPNNGSTELPQAGPLSPNTGFFGLDGDHAAAFALLVSSSCLVISVFILRFMLKRATNKSVSFKRKW